MTPRLPGVAEHLLAAAIAIVFGIIVMAGFAAMGEGLLDLIRAMLERANGP